MNKSDNGVSGCDSATTMKQLQHQLMNHKETIVLDGRLAKLINMRHNTWPNIIIMLISLLAATAMELNAFMETGFQPAERFISLSSFPQIYIPTIIIIISGIRLISIMENCKILREDYSVIEWSKYKITYKRN